MRTKIKKERAGSGIRYGVVFSLLTLICLSCRLTSKDDTGGVESSNGSQIIRTFTGINSLDISTVSGSCEVLKGNSEQITVSLTYHYQPENTFEPVMNQYDDLLQLKEKMTGSNSGYSRWIITVPEDMNINFNSASGSMRIKDITGRITVHTASGNIDATGITLTAGSEFTSASGNVILSFSKSPAVDVLASSASGDAIISYNKNKVSGKIELKSRTEHGRIECPFKFTAEEKSFTGGQEYIMKSFTVGQDTPVVKIYTASGTARLKK